MALHGGQRVSQLGTAQAAQGDETTIASPRTGALTAAAATRLSPYFVKDLAKSMQPIFKKNQRLEVIRGRPRVIPRV